ncbi:MAG TPA: hypothetical protein VMR21_07415 [Vicinamibacteria bacterium]|nr:hypothetical protein [Vicinamibacteria bacterium]
MDPTQTLLALAAATTWDGGDGVVSTLRTELSLLVPFDAGELAVFMPTGYRRWTFTADEDPVAGDDLLLYLCRRVAPVRIDQPEEAEAFPETAARLRRRGLMSALALPLNAAGGPEGGVVLARRFGWAFAGTSVRGVSTAVSMAGLCLERSLALTALRRELEAAGQRLRQLEGRYRS